MNEITNPAIQEIISTNGKVNVLIIKIVSASFVDDKDIPAEIDISDGIAKIPANGIITPQNMLMIRRGQGLIPFLRESTIGILPII